MAMNEEMMDDYNDELSIHEIDFDYEFDAPRYFDFTRDECLAEAVMAEAWFLSARTYPHSPLVSKMIRIRDTPYRNESNGIVSESAGVECNIMLPHSFVCPVRELPSTDAMHRGITEDIMIKEDMIKQDMIKKDMKDELKPVKHLCRMSTLMKPTASNLAKQNARHITAPGYSRFPINPSKDRSLNSSNNEIQAFKRQKLEGGQFQKVSATNPLPDFIHKAPKTDATFNGKVVPPKLKLTIPKNPVLGTAKRAHRIITKTHQKNDKQIEHGFKALPLNKKILERPSLLLPKRSTPHLPEFQEFHLRTAERALQNSSVMSSSSINHSNFDKIISKQNCTFSAMGNEYVSTRRTHDSDAPKQEKFKDSYKFKATTQEKKISSTKRDGYVFSGNQTLTTQKEFNCRRDNKLPNEPPVELFNKLSLYPGVQSGGVTQMKFSTTNKVLKENRLGVLQQNNGWDRGPYGCVVPMPISGPMQVL